MALARRYLSKAHPHIATNYFVLVENFLQQLADKILPTNFAGRRRARQCRAPTNYLEYNSTISCSLNAGV